jgi:hypothetical protein
MITIYQSNYLVCAQNGPLLASIRHFLIPKVNRNSQILDREHSRLTTKYMFVLIFSFFSFPKIEQFTFVKVYFHPDSCSKMHRINFMFRAFSRSCSKNILVSSTYCNTETPRSTKCGIRPSTFFFGLLIINWVQLCAPGHFPLKDKLIHLNNSCGVVRQYLCGECY